MYEVAEGPLYETQRVHIPAPSYGPLNHAGAYAEIRQVRSGGFIGWQIEHGSARFGHSGTWGRDNASEAFHVFAQAIGWYVRD